MSGFKEPGFADRQKAALQARQNLLNKFRTQPGADDPTVKARAEERAAILDKEVSRLKRRVADRDAGGAVPFGARSTPASRGAQLSRCTESPASTRLEMRAASARWPSAPDTQSSSSSYAMSCSVDEPPIARPLASTT